MYADILILVKRKLFSRFSPVLALFWMRAMPCNGLGELIFLIAFLLNPLLLLSQNTKSPHGTTFNSAASCLQTHFASVSDVTSPEEQAIREILKLDNAAKDADFLISMLLPKPSVRVPVTGYNTAAWVCASNLTNLQKTRLLGHLVITPPKEGDSLKITLTGPVENDCGDIMFVEIFTDGSGVFTQDFRSPF